ncbi:MAG TPA: hypothetical protein VHW04_09240 [Solirubrobacteraceae bacterium]|jgi:hypothetical protein|nr:hypothetical protein [Solirubrobacteraceae bacterium]
MGCASRLAALAVFSVLAAAPAGASAATGYPGVLENDVSPAISGDVALGGTAVASPGEWSGQGPIAYAYQWQACSPACASIPGATTSTYAPAAADLGARLVVIVTASNANTSYAVASTQSAAIAPAPEQVQASLSGQLIPHDRTLAVAIGLQTRRGYRLAFDPPVTGVVTVDWYLGAHAQLSADRHGLVLVASGSTRIGRLGPSAVQIRTTARGRKLVKRSRSLRLTALATLVPTQSPAVAALGPFQLT